MQLTDAVFDVAALEPITPHLYSVSRMPAVQKEREAAAALAAQAQRENEARVQV